MPPAVGQSPVAGLARCKIRPAVLRGDFFDTFVA